MKKLPRGEARKRKPSPKLLDLIQGKSIKEAIDFEEGLSKKQQEARSINRTEPK